MLPYVLFIISNGLINFKSPIIGLVWFYPTILQIIGFQHYYHSLLHQQNYALTSSILYIQWAGTYINLRGIQTRKMWNLDLIEISHCGIPPHQFLKSQSIAKDCRVNCSYFDQSGVFPNSILSNKFKLKYFATLNLVTGT